MTWTDKRIEHLTDRWAEGASAGVIADELGGLTRSAVIGKVHRLGLPKRRTHEHAERGHTPPSRPRRSNRDIVGLLCNRAADQGKVTLPESKVPIEPTAVFRCTLMGLNNDSCRWPVIDGPPMLFCGSPSADITSNIPYCGFHSRFAYQVRMR